jgi:hypothetical protein
MLLGQPAEFLLTQASFYRLVVVGLAMDVGVTSAFAGTDAASGQAFGSGLIGSSLGSIGSGSNQGVAQSFGAVDPNQMSAAQGIYSPGSVGMTDPSINNYGNAQQVLLQSTTCMSAAWAPALAVMQTNAASAVQSMSSVCTAVAHSLQQSLSQIGASASAVQVQQAGQAVGALLSMGGSSASQVQSFVANCGGTPACNLVNPTDMTNAANTIVTAANAGQAACAGLPVSFTASGLAGQIAAIQAILTGYQAASTSSLLAQIRTTCQYAQSYNSTTSNGQVNIGTLMGPSTGTSLAGGVLAAGNPITKVLNNPANAGLISEFSGFMQANNAAFSQVFTSCAAAQTKYATIAPPGVAGSAPGTTTVTTVSPPVVSPCSGNPTGQVGNTLGFPAVGMTWMYGNTALTCPGPAQAVYLNAPYENPTANPQTLSFTLASTSPASLVINGATVLTSPGTAAGGAPAPAASAAVTIPGTVQGSSPTEFSVVTGGGAVELAILNGSGTTAAVLNPTWSVSASSTPPAPVTTTTTTPSSTVTIPTPSAQQNTVVCKAAIQCMGTQCHSVMSTQDLSFSKAATSLSALQQLQENACCAPGTSAAAGNCTPQIFCGKPATCRTFPGAGWLTNDCCNDPVKTPLLSTLLKIGTIAYSAGLLSSAGSAIMSSAPNWVSSDYNSMSGWYDATTSSITSAAGTAWSTVSGPWKSMAASVANAFGAGGPTAESQFFTGAKALVNVTGTNTATATTSQGGALASDVQVVGAAATVLSGALVGVADTAIEFMAGPAAAGIESVLFGSASAAAAGTADAAGATYTGAVAGSAGSTAGSAGATGAGTGVGAPAAGIGILGVIAIVYATYEIVVLIAHILTSCTNDEFTLYQDNHNKECHYVGDWCKTSFLGMCLETDQSYCCYPSPLVRIIMEQILMNQPGVNGGAGYGSVKAPNCGGLTPAQLATVDWSKINLSEWLGIIEAGGLMANTNTQAAAEYKATNASHPSGMVDQNNAPLPANAIYTGQ